jgi:hypothetical protein
LVALFFVPTDPDHGPSVSDLLTALCPKIQTRLTDVLSHLKSSSVSPRHEPFLAQRLVAALIASFGKMFDNDPLSKESEMPLQKEDRES